MRFLGYRDGVVEYGLDLRRAIARRIRRFRPEVQITATFESTHRPTGGRRIINRADHRAVGTAVLDAGNRWIFPDLLDENLPPWAGVGLVHLTGSNRPAPAVDVTDGLDTASPSLRAPDTHLRGATFLRGCTAAVGVRIGVPHVVAVQQIQLQG